MVRSKVENILKAVYSAELIDSLLDSYYNSLKEYKKENWQYFGNEIGQFIEVARRMIEFQLTSCFTPLENKLSNFNERVLIDWENKSSNYIEEYRIIIPRCLYSMYCMRNKRGMIHKNHIDPNKMDATVLLGNEKWVLAEFFRLVSSYTFDETEEIINSIICKETSMIWDTGNMLRVMNNKMGARDKVLCLLYIRDNQAVETLRKSIEYSNVSEFRKILKKLHKERAIEYEAEKCHLSPLGMERAEELLS